MQYPSGACIIPAGDASLSLESAHFIPNKARNFIKSVIIRVHSCLPRVLATLALTLTLGAAEIVEPPVVEPSAPVEAPAVAPSQSRSAYSASILRLDSMDTTGLNPDLVTVLTGYYSNNFTSQKHWDQVESIRFDGVLELPQGAIRFTAFKKKPDYCKIVIFAPNEVRIVMAYDGADAWQLNAQQSSALPVDMPADEALNFIRDATTGGHLLYPLVKGKKIELVGAASLNGRRHYDVLTTLPDGQAIRYLLDMTTFAETRQTTINNVNGIEEVITHGDFREIDGVSFPFVSTLTIDGQQIHQSRVERVQVNLGVMPWMFSRSSGAHVPAAPLAKANSTPQRGASSLLDQSIPVASKLSFGDSIADPWSTESAFDIDPAALSDQEAAQILQEMDAGK